MALFGVKLSAAFAVLTLASAASAERGLAFQPTRVALASAVVQRIAASTSPRADIAKLEAPAEVAEDIAPLPPRAMAEQVASSAPAESDESAGPAQRRSLPESKDSGYRALLGHLVITRDLQIPGAPNMAVRLIPVNSAISGETSPIVFRPRFVGSGWYGLDIAARF